MALTLPEPTDTSHLAPCAACGSLNGRSARWCWRCDALLAVAEPQAAGRSAGQMPPPGAAGVAPAGAVSAPRAGNESTIVRFASREPQRLTSPVMSYAALPTWQGQWQWKWQGHWQAPAAAPTAARSARATDPRLAHKATFALRAAVFGLGTARRSHAVAAALAGLVIGAVAMAWLLHPRDAAAPTAAVDADPPALAAALSAPPAPSPATPAAPAAGVTDVSPAPGPAPPVSADYPMPERSPAALPHGVGTTTPTPVPSSSFGPLAAPDRGMARQFGDDLVRLVAPEAKVVDLRVLLTPRPAAKARPRADPGVKDPGMKFALVRSDRVQGLLDQATPGNARARALVRPLRVVLPLYAEDVHFIARADAPFDFVHQVRDARINVGPSGSPDAVSIAALYRRMFGAALPAASARFLSPDAALAELTGARSVDVVAIVGGHLPAWLAALNPEARRHLKLLRVDDADPAATKASSGRATLPAAPSASRPPADLPGLALRSYLVTRDDGLPRTQAQLRQFARALCRNLPRLQANGHAGWREVSLALPELEPGWRYAVPTASEIQRCVAGEPPARLAPIRAKPRKASTRPKR